MRVPLAAALLVILLPAMARPTKSKAAMRALEPLPTDPTRRHARDFPADGGWTRLSEHFHRTTDACNVCALVDGDAALLVDFGARLEMPPLPPGFPCAQPRRDVTIRARTAAAVPFTMRRTGRPDGRRRAATADVTVNGHSVGEYPEFPLP